jgi:plastocyanin
MNKIVLIAGIIVLMVISVLILGHKTINNQPATPTLSETPNGEDLPVSSNKPENVAPSSGSQSGSNGSNSPTPVPSGHTVLIQNFSFKPAVLTIRKGDTVTFINKDSVIHTATMIAAGFNSGNLQSNQSFTLHTSAMEPSSYEYHCNFHPSMKGTLVIK